MSVNVTLVSIIIIILLFIPGFFFKRFYYIGQFTKQFHSGTFAERFISSVFWGLIIQIITLVVLGRFTKLDYNALREPITKFYAELSDSKLPQCSPDNFYLGVQCVGASIIIAIVLGWFCHKLVRLLKLDIYFPVLRFTNYWNYYLRGDLRQLRALSRRGKVISTNIDALVKDVKNDAHNTVLYTGFVSHYSISPVTGDLETIALSNPERWSTTDKRFKSIKSDCLIIPYSTVVNMNLRYNIQQVTSTQRLNRYVDIFGVIMIVAIIFYIPVTYNGLLATWKIIVSIILSVLEFSVILMALASPLSKVFRAANRRERVGMILAQLIIMGLIATALYFLLRLPD